MAGRGKSICHGTHDAHVRYNNYPEDEPKRQLLSLVMKSLLSHQGTRPSTKERQHVQGALGHSTTSVGRSSFVQAICDKRDEAHQDDDNQVNGGSYHHALSTGRADGWWNASVVQPLPATPGPQGEKSLKL